MENRDKVNALKDVIRHPYAFPGGYERVLVTTDGGVVCHRCAKEEYYTMLHSTRAGYRDGWDVEGDTVVYTNEDKFYVCDHCGREIG